MNPTLMVRQLKLSTIFLIFLLPITLTGQKTPAYNYGDTEYLRGLQLYETEKYSAAKNTLDLLISDNPGSKSEILSEAYFYRAMSAIELRNDDSEFLVQKFVAEYPESPHVNEACFRLGDYFYNKNSWPSSISWYNRVDRYALTSSEFSEYHFKKGYSYYKRNDFEAARVEFYEILEMESPYNAPATYYYSHIHYEDQNYETALMGFRKIDDDPLFSEIAPYYVSQILYIQKKYDEVIDYAPLKLASVSERRMGEISKIIGESYFMQEQYADAIPYLETYQNHAKSYSVRDRYQLAFAYYSNEEYDNAIVLFEKISYNKTEIAQSALYHLADCYMKQDMMVKARVAFSQAANMDFDPRIKQDALFNFAKVTFELSLNPFNEAIRAFETYIRSYPAADNTDEAINYLIMAYLGTRNYSMALESIGRVKQRSETIDKAHQKVAFYRGLELYKNLKFDEAVDVLEMSIEYARHDPVIASRTYFWLGEAAYRMGDRNTAKMYYNQFLSQDQSYAQDEFAMCHYSMGYLHFNDKAYDESIVWFGKFLKLEAGKSLSTIGDALNRMADCYFVNLDYSRAIDYYNQCIESGRADVDYAMFQKGFTLGLLGRTLEKVNVLSQLIEEQPQSAFVDDALFEIARSYVVLNRQDEARKYYEQVIADHPNSNYTGTALNQLGLINYNAGAYDNALGYYEQVATDFLGTPEADNALASIKNIYVRKDNVDGYLAFVTGLGQDISLWEQDSLSYTAAEIVYNRGDCEQTAIAFSEYIKDFPNGRFLLNAHFYKADCQLKIQQNESALESLQFIINQPSNLFSELALEAASKIYFRQEDYSHAAESYRNLIEVANQKYNIFDAYVGLMRCYYELGEYTNSINAATKVLELDKVQEEYIREANFRIAKSFQELDEVDFAKDYYRKVAREVNSEEGAESKYRGIEIRYKNDDLDGAEKEIFEFIEMNTPHQYWMGMSFLTLSDIYIAKDDVFSAINSLQSLIDYYTIPDDGIIDNAKQRRASLADIVDEELETVEKD